MKIEEMKENNKDQIIEIVDEIDNVFHRNGYVISHDKIAHFVVDCIRENARLERSEERT